MSSIALSVAPRLGSCLSICGSSWIILEVLGDKNKRQVVYHRLLLVFSCFDIVVSSFAFASTWPLPEDTPDAFAVGNDVSCTIQGVALQLGSVLFTYNAVLSIYYVLVIRRNVSEEILRKREIFLHAPPISFGFLTAMMGVIFNLYHPADLWCWIAVDPDCEECHDKNLIDSLRWILFFAPLWICFLIQFICLFLVYWSVKQQEKRQAVFQTELPNNNNNVINTTRGIPPRGIARRRHASQRRRSMMHIESESNSPTRSRQVAWQCVLYIGVFFYTYVFASINRIIQAAANENVFVIQVLHSLALPMQGILNFLVYRRPCYLRLRRNNPNLSRLQVIRQCLTFTRYRRTTGHYPRASTANRISHLGALDRPAGNHNVTTTTTTTTTIKQTKCLAQHADAEEMSDSDFFDTYLKDDENDFPDDAEAQMDAVSTDEHEEADDKECAAVKNAEDEKEKEKESDTKEDEEEGEDEDEETEEAVKQVLEEETGN